MKNLYSYDDIDVHNLSCINNISILDELMVNMNKFINNYNFDDFKFNIDIIENVKMLLNDAGISLEG